MTGTATHAGLERLTLAAELGSRPFYFRKGTSDEGVIDQTFAQKHHDLSWLSPPHHAALMAYVARKAADGARPLVVDAGANIGASAVFLAFAMPGARIVAIEPDAANAGIMRKNVEGLDVEVLQAALASTRGRSKVVDPGQGHWGLRTVDAGGDPAGVPNVTIPEIYARHQPGFFPAIVKIDIEGAEKDVFRGALPWVSQTPVLIVELHDWLFPRQRTSSTFLEVIAGLNRDFVTVGENVLSVSNDLI